MTARGRKLVRRLASDYLEGILTSGYPESRAGLYEFWNGSRSLLEAEAALAGLTPEALAENVLAAIPGPSAVVSNVGGAP